ncbi:MAG: hypothetical protein M1812_004048 [Candelaria pacifica]|nr:MAG: hypothetical protein M1812_004048 [Candelaria pacifica]
MVEMKVETTEPDPSATSISNDQTVNSEGATVPGQVVGKSDEIEGAKTGDEEMQEQGSGGVTAQEKPDTDRVIKETTESKSKNKPIALDATAAPSNTMTEKATVTEESSASQAEKDTKEDSKSAESKGSGRTSRDFKPRSREDYESRKPNYNENVKTDFTSQKESDDPDQIRKQVEFYFSDSNLPFDQFLFEKVGGSQNKPVKISVLHNFKRMRHFQPYSAVVASLRDSTFLEVTDDESVKRKVPIEEVKPEEAPKVYEDKTMGRSIYAKGFGEETPSTQFDIEAFFAPYGPTNAIRLRRTQTKVFKSSVFVEFDNEATQKAFLALEPKPKWKGEPLLIKSKYDYVKDKEEDVKAGRIKPENPWPTKEKSDNRDWKTRRDEDQKNGFRNARGRGGHGGHGSFGRGRGSGNRGRKGNDRDRNSEREKNGEKGRSERGASGGPDTAASKAETTDKVNPAPATSAKETEALTSEISAENKKPTRDDEQAGEDKAHAEKSGTKLEVSNGVDKKRAREDDDEAHGQGSSKKADLKTGPS